MAWFAVRSVYLFGRKSDGTNVFEERIVVFKARSADQAHKKALKESKRYARQLKLQVHPMRESYEQDGEPLIDGYEVWSVLLESRETLARFFASRYSRYNYHPE